MAIEQSSKDNSPLKKEFQSLLDQDFKELCDDLDLDHEPLPHLAQSSGEHYSHYYNEETKNIIAEAWSEDVANFGYEYETV